MKLWSVKDKQCLKTFRGHTSSVACLDYCPDGRWFASGSEDGTLILWDARMCKRLQEIQAHDGPIVDLQFHPEKQYLASVSADRTSRIWALNSSCEQIFSTDKEKTKLRRVCFVGKKNLDHLMTVSEDCLKVWNWEADAFVEQHECSSVAKLVRDVSFDPDEHVCKLFTSRGSTISIWQQKLLQSTLSPVTTVLSPSNREPVLNNNQQDSLASEQKESKSTSPRLLQQTSLDNYKDDSFKIRKANGERDPGCIDKDEIDLRVEDLARFSPAESKRHERTRSDAAKRPGEMNPQARANCRREVAEDTVKESKSQETFPPVGVFDDHEAFVKKLKSRLEQAKALGDLDLKEGAHFLLETRDAALVAQSLRESDIERKLGDIDSCAYLLPLLAFLFTSSAEEHLVVALSMTKFFLKSFAVTIKSTLEWSRKHSNVTTTVDIARDNRIHKCEKCWSGFIEIQRAMKSLETDSSAASSTQGTTTEHWSTATKRDLKYVTDRLDKFLNE